jgi:beta-ureidopropionase
MKTDHHDRSTDRTAIWAAGLSQTGIQAATPDGIADQFLQRLDTFAPLDPDIICLPETFPCTNLKGPVPRLDQIAEAPPGPITSHFAAYARDKQCYVICPTYTEENGKYYNAAVVFDRQGNVMGEYRKIHLTTGEIDAGLTPGPLEVPVFDTDFGRIGIQICFDIEWTDGWESLRDQGAELVFWPSAFAGGQALNALASRYHYPIVSSTQKDATKIVGVTGTDLAVSGRWEEAGVCLPLNLETAFVHTWPHYQHFDAIRRRYGRRILIHTRHDEEWSILKSLDAGLCIKNVLLEFDIPTHDEMTHEATARQDAARG